MAHDSKRAATEIDNAPQSILNSLTRIASLFGSRVGGTVLMFAYTVLLLRLTSQEVFGLTMTGMAWLVLAAMIVTLNVDAGAIRFMVDYRSRCETDKLAGFVRFNIWILFAMSVGVSALVGLCVATGFVDLQREMDQVMVIGLLGAFAPAYVKILTAQTTALNAVVRAALPSSLGYPICLCILLGIYVASGLAISASGLMLMTVAAFGLTAALQYILIHRELDLIRGHKARLTDWREWLQTGLFLTPQVALNNNLKQIVTAAAGLALVATQIAELALALSVIALLHFATKAVDIAFSPSLSRAIQTGDDKDALHQLRRVSAIKFIGFVVGAVLLYLLIGWFLALFGEEYRSARIPALILLLLPATEVVFGPTGLVLNVTANNTALFWSTLVGSAVLIGATIAGGILAGTTGAALGCGLSYLVTRYVQREICVRSAGFDPSLLCLRPIK